VGSAKPDEVRIARWDNVQLKNGDNVVEVSATINGKSVKDRCVWHLDSQTER
jgi:hypothetical protein